MKRIKKLINCVINDTVCNLKCPYCYIGQLDKHVNISTVNKHTVEEMRKALSYERLGGACHLNICAVGETLLVEHLIEMICAFTKEGHLVSVVTNGIAEKKIKEICELPESCKENIFMKLSFHYLELKKRNLLKQFWDNVKMIEKSNLSFTIELTVNDETVPYIDDVMKECVAHTGVLCHVIESRVQDGNEWPRLTKLPLLEHQNAWGRFESPLFQFQQKVWGEKRTEFCYAGNWICSVNLKTGDVMPCFGGGHILDNIYAYPDRPINFQAIGHKCPWQHCYAAYVLLAHGAIPDFQAPFYAEERNRTPEDGVEWLRPSVKEAFESRLGESNDLYCNNRKILTDFVMGIRYGSPCSDMKDIKRVIKSYLEKKHYHKIAIYGAGKIGEALYRILIQCDAQVVCYMDRYWDKINKELLCCPADAHLADAELIIITPYHQYNEIFDLLRKNNEADVVSILDLYTEN